MKVIYIPIRDDSPFKYSFDGEIVTAEFKGKVDTFDFSPLSLGDKLESVETTLEVNPIVSAERRSDGILYLKLIYHHGKDATEDERFPTWKEV